MTRPVDLSRRGIQERRKPQGAAGQTGRELIDIADVTLARANRKAKAAARAPAGDRRAKLQRQADDLLQRAAKAIRVAERVPLETGYRHALTVPTLTSIDVGIRRAFDDDRAGLAVTTHRQIIDQRARVRAEGTTP